MGARSRWTLLAVIAVAFACAEPAMADDPPVPPGQPQGLTVDPASPGNDKAPAWSWDVDLGVTGYECHIEPATDPEPDPSTTWTPCSPGYDPPLDADGEYRFGVRALLLGIPGNEATETYTLDTTGPTLTIDSGPTGQVSDASVSFSFSSEAGATTSCSLTRDGALVFDWTACTSPWERDLSTQPDGNYTFAVRAADDLGNPSEATRSFTLGRPRPAGQNGQAAPATTPSEPKAGEPTTLALRPGVCLNLFNGTPGADTISGSGFGDVLVGLAGNDRLDGLDGADCVIGNAGNDVVDGGTGDDDVRGSSGNDTVDGRSGDDTLSGSAGRDVLAGGRGNDQIDGNSGTDRISGGPGKDTIDADDGRRDRVNCGTGRDTVTADRIDKLAGCEKKALRGRRR